MIRRSKYGNKKTYCYLGHKHDSRFEAVYCARLQDMKQKGEIQDFVVQYTFDFVFNGHPICKHIVDFSVLKNDGSLEVHDTKGFCTDVWRIKYKIFKALNPDIPYMIVKRRGGVYAR